MSEYLTGNKTQTDDGVMRLRAVIDKLSAGQSPASVKKEFHELIKGASAEQVAAMEQALIDGGLPVQEVQRLCEVHADVFKEGLEKTPKVARMPGHPVHTYLAENAQARKRMWALRLAGLAGSVQSVRRATDDLRPIIIHYTRKENQLFPFLEKTGFTGPTKVMWGKHDEIRDRFRAVDAAISANDVQAARREARLLAGQMTTMMFMEERILYPNSLKRLTAADWAKLRNGDDQIGYAWVTPGAMWDSALAAADSPAEGAKKVGTYSAFEAAIASATDKTAPASGLSATPTSPHPGNPSTVTPGHASAPEVSSAVSGQTPVRLSEGELPVAVLDLVLKNLPLDISFVDADDRVLYYSDSPHRVFPRSPAIIGRSVQNCHPPKSVATVERILEAFKKKEKDSASFWLELHGRFIVISYKAIYGADGTYLGTLEASWDATEMRAMEGQRTLLDW